MIRKLSNSYRTFLLTLFIGGISFVAGTQQLNAQAVIGARELAMGEASTALAGTNWSMFGNPALMPEDQRSASFFGVRYYGFAEITDMAVSLTYPTKIGVLGAGAHRYGFDLFSENRLRAGYKNSFMGFHYGVVLNYSHVTQAIDNGSAGALGVDVGVAAPVLDNLWIGAKATNINQPEYGSRNDEKLPRDLSVGFSYQIADLALITSDVYKDINFPIAYRAGMEVKIVDALVGRAGITTSPQTFTAGFGYSSDRWGVNVAVQRHENKVLGFSPAIDFQINW